MNKWEEVELGGGVRRKSGSGGNTGRARIVSLLLTPVKYLIVLCPCAPMNYK